MRAAVYHGPRQISVEEVPEPQLRPGTVKIAVDWCVLAEVDLVGTIGYNHDHPATITLMQDGHIDARGLITKRIGLEEIVEGGFNELIEHKDRHAKILARP